MTIEKVKSLIKRATIVIIDGTSYRVDYCEPDYFMATDEDNGDDVAIEYYGAGQDFRFGATEHLTQIRGGGTL